MPARRRNQETSIHQINQPADGLGQRFEGCLDFVQAIRDRSVWLRCKILCLPLVYGCSHIHIVSFPPSSVVRKSFDAQKRRTAQTFHLRCLSFQTLAVSRV